MINVYCVTYWESPDTDTCSSKYFDASSVTAANKFAKKISKDVGRTAKVWLSKGNYFGGEFYEAESTLKSVFTDGVKQRL
jgi:hypothetical protein